MSNKRFSMLMFSPACLMEVMMMILMFVSLHLHVHGYRGCIESERKGLLELKAYLTISEFAYDWPNDTNSDCCRWERVKCDLNSGRVISLFLSDTYHQSKSLLNLSLFYPFEGLQTLNLSRFGCSGWFDDIHGYKSLGRLKNLEILDLGENSFNHSVLPFLNTASSLKTLILHGNYYMEGTFPMKELENLTNLELLDLSGNSFIGPVPDLGNFHKLQGLDLSDNKFSGSLENKGLCQLKDLRELDLSHNKLIGQFPQCFDRLTQLQVLDISSNKLIGRLPSFIRNLDSIEYLSLSDNEFEGLFSFELIANLSKLKVFKLSSRSSLLKVNTEISWEPRFQLSVIELQNCNLKTVPWFLHQHQKDLRVINLSDNKLTGPFPSLFLEKYPRLRVLLLQNNSFTMFQLPRLVNLSLEILDVSTNEFDGRLPGNIGKVLPNLIHLNLSSNVFQGKLPPSLGKMKMLHFLDISRNNLSNTLPLEFLMGCDSLTILKLSYNRLHGQIFPIPTNLKGLIVLIANNNLFTGISGGLLHSEYLSLLDLSNNHLQGSVPSWFGQNSFFLYVSVSNNLLHGPLPSTLFNIQFMKTLDLSGNKFSGNLPLQFNGQYMSLLYLHDNEFTGTIPSTLIKDVLVLDLRNNKLSGTIPSFFNNKDVISLLLRGNRLTGHIPNDLCALRSIRILDLANNRLDGSIPSCLNNLSFGRGFDYETDSNTYSNEIDDQEMEVYSRLLVLPREFSRGYTDYLNFIVDFPSKSRYDSYTGGSFDFMFGLDLSSNKLTGEIPRELGDLQKIRAMNLSHNSLSGMIPGSFSNLTDIESIDLSFNVLRGPIPQKLTKLDYMVVFNVSYNNLSGSIPSQGKFSTLDKTNYIGNPFLCGTALATSCDGNNTTGVLVSDSQSEDEETTIDLVIFYWSLVATCSVTWITFIVFLCFDSPWRQVWFRLVDAFISFFFKSV